MHHGLQSTAPPAEVKKAETTIVSPSPTWDYSNILLPLARVSVGTLTSAFAAWMTATFTLAAAYWITSLWFEDAHDTLFEFWSPDSELLLLGPFIFVISNVCLGTTAFFALAEILAYVMCVAADNLRKLVIRCAVGSLIIILNLAYIAWSFRE